MPDYDLGKAHGEVVIDYDNKKIKAADKDVEKLAETTKDASDDIEDAARQAAEAYEQTQKAAKLLASEVKKAAVAEEAAAAKVQVAQENANKAREAAEEVSRKQEDVERGLSQAMEESGKAAAKLNRAEYLLSATRQQIADRSNDATTAERNLATAMKQTQARTEELAKAEEDREQAFLHGTEFDILDAEDRLEQARSTLSAATGLLGDSEQKVNSARSTANAATTYLADAEQKVADAREQLGVASERVAVQEKNVESARTSSAQAALQASAAELKLSAAEDRASTSAQRARAAHDALNVSLNKIKDQEINIRIRTDNDGDDGLDEVKDKINQVNRTASSGLSGLNSFVGRTQAMVGAAALAAPQLAGLAVSLAQVAQAGAIVPGVLAAAGAAIATLLVGASGIGAAFKESGKAAGGAGAAAKQSAAAQKAAADGIRSAEQGLVKAKQNLTIAYEDAARAAEQSVRRVADAEKAVTAAQKTAVRAQMDLTAARKDAKRMVEDYALAVRGGAIDEREAIASVAEAQKELDDVMRTPAATQADRDKAQLALDRQKFSLDELRVRNQRLGEDASDATAKQIEGSDQVVAAQEAIAAAADQIAEAQTAVKDAVADQARAQIDSQRNIADAIQQVENAELALQRAHEASAEAGISGAGGVESALSKLSPKAQEFVKAVLAQAAAWKDVKFAVQDALFDNAAKAVTQLANTYLPILKKGMVGVATEINAAGLKLKDFLLEAQTTKDVATIFDNTKLSIKNLSPGLVAIAQILRDIATVGTDFLPGLAGGFSNAAEKAAEFVKQARESGKLKEFIQAGLDAAKVLFDVLVNIGSIFVTIFKAFDQQGGGTLSLLRDLTDQLDTFLKSAEGQDFLKELGKTLYYIGANVIGLVIKAIEILVPLLTALGPVVQDLADSFGAILGGALIILAPLLESLAHFVQNNSDWIVKIATAIGIWTAAQWLLNIALDANPIGAVIIAIVALIAIVQLIIDNWGPISDFFKNLWDGIATYIEFRWNAIKQFFTDVIDGIVNFFKLRFQAISDFISNILDGIENFFVLRWQAITQFLSDTIDGIANFFTSRWNAIRTTVSDAVTGMRDTANQKIGEIGRFFSELPGNILRALGDLGRLLVNAGKAIINGLLDGLLDAWRSVQNFIGGIGSWIADNKGPLSYDRGLLVAAGSAIMGGFNDSLQSEFEKVMAFVATVGPSVADAAKTADIESTMRLSTVLGGSSGTLGSLTVAGGMGIAPGATTAVNGAASGGGGSTLVIENVTVTVAGNLDPTDPVKWRETMKRLEDDLKQLGRDNQ